MDPALAATNAAVFAMISKAVAGKARAHLTDTFQKYAADSDMDPGELSDLEHDSDAGTPSISGTRRWTEQRQFMDTSAYLAWQVPGYALMIKIRFVLRRDARTEGPP